MEQRASFPPAVVKGFGRRRLKQVLGMGVRPGRQAVLPHRRQSKLLTEISAAKGLPAVLFTVFLMGVKQGTVHWAAI